MRPVEHRSDDSFDDRSRSNARLTTATHSTPRLGFGDEFVSRPATADIRDQRLTHEVDGSAIDTYLEQGVGGRLP
jgi:hypothetical protein